MTEVEFNLATAYQKIGTLFSWNFMEPCRIWYKEKDNTKYNKRWKDQAR